VLEFATTEIAAEAEATTAEVAPSYNATENH